MGSPGRHSTPNSRDPDWQFLWYEHADTTIIAPWVIATLGLLGMVVWLMAV